MDKGTFVTIPIDRWNAIQDRMDTLEHKITELCGKDNVSVVKFNNVSNLEENRTSYDVYTNEDLIIKLADREQEYVEKADRLYKELQYFKNKSWW